MMEEAPLLRLIPNLRRESPPPIWPLEELPYQENPLRSLREDNNFGVENRLRNVEELEESENRQTLLRTYVEKYGRFQCLHNNELFKVIAKAFMNRYMELLQNLDNFNYCQMQEDLEYEFKFPTRKVSYESFLHCGILMIHKHNPRKVTWEKLLYALRDMKENGLLDKLFSQEHNDKWEKLTAGHSDPNRQPVESFTPDDTTRDVSQCQFQPCHNQVITSTSLNNNNSPPSDSGVGISFPTGSISVRDQSAYCDATVTTTTFSPQNYHQAQTPVFVNNFSNFGPFSQPEWQVYQQQTTPYVNERMQMNPITSYNSLPGSITPITTPTLPLKPLKRPTSVVLITHSEDAEVDAERLAQCLWQEKNITGITLKNITQLTNQPLGSCLGNIFKMLKYFVPVISPMYIRDIKLRNDNISPCNSIYSMLVKRIHCEMDSVFLKNGCKNFHVRPVHTSAVSFQMRQELGPYLWNSRRLWEDAKDFVENLAD